MNKYYNINVKICGSEYGKWGVREIVYSHIENERDFLFFLIVVIDGLLWIDSNIELDTCAKGRWRVEV